MAERGLRRQLIKMLREPNAHLMLDTIVDGFPTEKCGAKPDGFSHSPWQLLEHLRIAQEDILRFSIDADWESPVWPEGYWPAENEPPAASAWRDSIAAFNRDLNEMAELIVDESHDLHKPFEHGDGQTLFVEAILLIKHNSYHMGQLMMLRKHLEHGG